jgi:hypothetical protein
MPRGHDHRQFVDPDGQLLQPAQVVITFHEADLGIALADQSEDRRRVDDLHLGLNVR